MGICDPVSECGYLPKSSSLTLSKGFDSVAQADVLTVDTHKLGVKTGVFGLQFGNQCLQL